MHACVYVSVCVCVCAHAFGNKLSHDSVPPLCRLKKREGKRDDGAKTTVRVAHKLYFTFGLCSSHTRPTACFKRHFKLGPDFCCFSPQPQSLPEMPSWDRKQQQKKKHLGDHGNGVKNLLNVNVQHFILWGSNVITRKTVDLLLL